MLYASGILFKMHGVTTVLIVDCHSMLYLFYDKNDMFITIYLLYEDEAEQVIIVCGTGCTQKPVYQWFGLFGIIYKYTL